MATGEDALHGGGSIFQCLSEKTKQVALKRQLVLELIFQKGPNPKLIALPDNLMFHDISFLLNL